MKARAEQREQRILVLTLVGVGVAIVGLGYQMALPDPNAFIGCAVMLCGVAFVEIATWQTQLGTGIKLLVTLAVFGAVLIPAYLLVSARPNFKPRIMSVLLHPRNDNATDLQLWADVRNTGNKAGLIREWHCTVTIAKTGQTLEGLETYGVAALTADNKQMQTDSL